MRILLVHNPKAGDREHTRKHLMASLAAFGHKAFYQSTKKSGWKKTFDKSVDLVIAAGGDGTVRKVAWQLMDSGVPLAILPLGTANNLARSLGFTATADEIIARLNDGQIRTLDVGIVRDSSSKNFFLEAAGGGLLADYLADPECAKEDKNASKRERLRQHVSWLRKISAHYPARLWNISVDGEDCSDRYLLWEAMNIRSAGPALVLAPRAVTDDGELDFVGVREQDRDVFEKYLSARIAGHPRRFPFTARKFRQLQIVRRAALMHVDGKMWPEKKTKAKILGPVEVKVRPATLMICGSVLQHV